MTATTSSTTPTHSRKLRDCTKPPVSSRTMATIATMTSTVFKVFSSQLAERRRGLEQQAQYTLTPVWGTPVAQTTALALATARLTFAENQIGSMISGL